MLTIPLQLYQLKLKKKTIFVFYYYSLPFQLLLHFTCHSSPASKNQKNFFRKVNSKGETKTNSNTFTIPSFLVHLSSYWCWRSAAKHHHHHHHHHQLNGKNKHNFLQLLLLPLFRHHHHHYHHHWLAGQFCCSSFKREHFAQRGGQLFCLLFFLSFSISPLYPQYQCCALLLAGVVAVAVAVARTWLGGGGSSNGSSTAN